MVFWWLWRIAIWMWNISFHYTDCWVCRIHLGSSHSLINSPQDTSLKIVQPHYSSDPILEAFLSRLKPGKSTWTYDLGLSSSNYKFVLFFFLIELQGWQDLSFLTRMEHGPLTVKLLHANHWTARKSQIHQFYQT